MPRLLHHQPDNMPTARRPIQSKPDPRRPADPPAPECQANSIRVTPRLTSRPASVLNTPNCAKMAHLRPLLNRYPACEWAADRILRSGGQRQGVIASRVGIEPGLPELVKAATRMDTAQDQDIFGSGLTPKHARVLATGTDDGLTAGFHDA